MKSWRLKCRDDIERRHKGPVNVVQVNSILERDSDPVIRPPVYEVQVEIVLALSN